MPSPPDDLSVDHDIAASRYLLRRGAQQVGMLGYTRRGTVVETYTTQISPDARGQGLGAVLVRHVLDDLARERVTVIPTCWYVDQFIDEHEEYEPLRAAPADNG